jgi:tetratricopeptide (TPR) repeat protein
MNRKLIVPVVFLVAVLVGGAPAHAIDIAFDPVSYVIGKALDEIIVDRALVGIGLKPDVGKLEQRLTELEKTAALKSDQKEALRKLREQIAACATHDELAAVASKFKSDLQVLSRRLDRNEEDLEELKVKFEDKDKGTKNADDPNHFLTRGERELGYSEHFKALANARIAAKLAPDKPEGLLFQGKVYTAMGAGEMALACYDQAIKVAPMHALSFRTRADARFGLANYAGAADDYGQAARLDPKDAWSWSHRGQARMELEQFAQAAEDFSEALKLNASDAVARFQRGRAYIFTEQPAKAVDDFTVYLRDHPDDPDGHDRRGYAHLKSGEHDKSLEDLQKALKLSPDHPLAHIHLTHLWDVKGEHTRAVEVGKRAVELNPGHWYAHYHYAHALQLTGNPTDALAHYEQAALLNPGNKEKYQELAYGGAGLICAAQKSSDKAIDYLSRALALNGNLRASSKQSLLTFRAQAYIDKKDHASAIADATAALAINADDPDAYFARAYAHAERKEHADAVRDYTETIRIAPSSSGAFNNRGNSQRALGETAKAIDDFTEAIRLDPKHDFAYSNRGDAYRSQARYAEAANDFVQALKSSVAGTREGAIDSLIQLRPGDSELLKAIPAGANAFGTYSNVLRRIHVPDDKDDYGNYNNYGWSTTSSYRGYDGLPSGYWVYVAPYWYIWETK